MAKIFSMDEGTTSLDETRLSTRRTTPPLQRTPTAVVPRFTASRAYSTWKRRPSGEKTVIARSYAMLPCGCIVHLRGEPRSKASQGTGYRVPARGGSVPSPGAKGHGPPSKAARFPGSLTFPGTMVWLKSAGAGVRRIDRRGCDGRCRESPGGGDPVPQGAAFGKTLGDDRMFHASKIGVDLSTALGRLLACAIPPAPRVKRGFSGSLLKLCGGTRPVPAHPASV